MKPVKILIVGAGDRGYGYSAYAQEFPEKATIVGVAEPLAFRRNALVEKFNIDPQYVFQSWEEAIIPEKFADAVIIATQDNCHTQPALAFAKKGYHILLEKPMAQTEAECREIVKVVNENKVMFAVCHVLRYTNYTQELKKILLSGRIGEIVSIQHLEPVGFWHQAHSFVRGNWRNSKESTFMLLAKSCHDLDWIRYMVDKKCMNVSSFGSLKHFTSKNKPAGATERCLDCPAAVESQCPYSARRVYFNCWQKGYRGWPLTIITEIPSPEAIEKALREGPYGRCVYSCDNDVVDNQVVNFEFEDGVTGTFTMTAFTELTDRRTRIFGTKGEIEGNGRHIKVFDFITEKKTEIDTHKANSILQGHGGGDFGLMDNFISAIADNDPAKIITGPAESLESHLMVFSAEKARQNKTVEPIIMQEI